MFLNLLFVVHPDLHSEDFLLRSVLFPMLLFPSLNTDNIASYDQSAGNEGLPTSHSSLTRVSAMEAATSGAASSGSSHSR